MIPSRSLGETIASCKLALCNGVVHPMCGLARDAAALEVGGAGFAEVACVLALGAFIPAPVCDSCGSVFV